MQYQLNVLNPPLNLQISLNEQQGGGGGERRPSVEYEDPSIVVAAATDTMKKDQGGCDFYVKWNQYMFTLLLILP